MADGRGCTCFAYYSGECACDADWTPQEVIDLRAENKKLRENYDKDERKRIFDLTDRAYNSDPRI